jgi:hypothetical protein
MTPQETFALCIRPLAQLRTLALRIVPSQGEVSPRLECFELVFLPRTPTSTFSRPTPTLPISRARSSQSSSRSQQNYYPCAPKPSSASQQTHTVSHSPKRQPTAGLHRTTTDGLPRLLAIAPAQAQAAEGDEFPVHQQDAYRLWSDAQTRLARIDAWTLDYMKR